MTLLTANEAALRWKVSAAWLLALARGGAIEHVRFGRLVRFEEGALDRYLESHRAYTADQHGQAEGEGERRRVGLSRPTRTRRKAPPKAVGGEHHRGLDHRGSPHPAHPLRVVGTDGEGEAA